jgi:TPP-dependent 2-oxoacid decarboxylase
MVVAVGLTGCSPLCCCLAAGGPNSNDFAANHTVHHTIGEKDLGQQYRAFKEVTWYTTR